MPTRVSLIFPYIGDDDEVRKRLCQIIEAIREPENNLNTSNTKPILVVNNDSIQSGMYEKFRDYLKGAGKPDLLNKMDIIKVWSVDTCQMWLAGFGKIIEDNTNNRDDTTTTILQIPGDLKYVVGNFDNFLNQLSHLGAEIESGHHDIVIGDFEVEPKKSKHLIDMYGTYPLLYNWFPDTAMEIREKLNIERPRSEFIAASLEFLKGILPNKRNFAYEETLALLIHALSLKYLFNLDAKLKDDLGLEDGLTEINVNKKLMDRFKTENGSISANATAKEVGENEWVIVDMHLFRWDRAASGDEMKLKEFLRNVFGIGWAENAKVSKTDDKTIQILKDDNSAEIIIDVTGEKATLKISGGRTYDLKVKKENGKLYVYKEKQAKQTFIVKKEKGKLNFYSMYTQRKWDIGKVDIGTISDFEQGRGFHEANNQIERTERLLKVLWREMNGGDNFDVFQFERLDRRSTAIREAAIVSLENFLRRT